MVDYFVERLPGVQIDRSSKKFYYDFYDSVVQGKLPIASLGLVAGLSLSARQHGARTQVLHHRSALPHQANPQPVLSHRRSAGGRSRQGDEPGVEGSGKAGAKPIQIDEPYYSGFPEDLAWGVQGLNTLVEGVDAHIAVHICYGNRYGKPSWEGSYRYLFPRILDAKVHQLTLEFARRGGEDLDLFKEFPVQFRAGPGRHRRQEHTISKPPEMVAEHIRKALDVLPPERIYVLPDCGCFHLPRDVAFAKMQAMVEGTKIVRKELGK